MLFFLSLINDDDSMANYNISKYLKIKFQTWTLVLDNLASYLNKEYDTRPCISKDFGDDQQSIDLFNKMNNSYYLNLCPDIK